MSPAFSVQVDRAGRMAMKWDCGFIGDPSSWLRNVAFSRSATSRWSDTTGLFMLINLLSFHN